MTVPAGHVYVPDVQIPPPVSEAFAPPVRSLPGPGLLSNLGIATNGNSQQLPVTTSSMLLVADYGETRPYAQDQPSFALGQYQTGPVSPVIAGAPGATPEGSQGNHQNTNDPTNQAFWHKVAHLRTVNFSIYPRFETPREISILDTDLTQYRTVESLEGVVQVLLRVRHACNVYIGSVPEVLEFGPDLTTDLLWARFIIDMPPGRQRYVRALHQDSMSASSYRQMIDVRLDWCRDMQHEMQQRIIRDKKMEQTFAKFQQKGVYQAGNMPTTIAAAGRDDKTPVVTIQETCGGSEHGLAQSKKRGKHTNAPVRGKHRSSRKGDSSPTPSDSSFSSDDDSDEKGKRKKGGYKSEKRGSSSSS
ncbi:MAG: hypothetical protein GY696_07105, partial [Gammaproteobacteria bacterium]|nr:hypothetical protein [Gammaproteobacteria bacterium]